MYLFFVIMYFLSENSPKKRIKKTAMDEWNPFVAVGRSWRAGARRRFQTLRPSLSGGLRFSGKKQLSRRL